MRVVAGFLLALVLMAAAALVVAMAGAFDVAASRPDSAPVAWLLSTTMRNSVARQAGQDFSTASASPEQIRQGFKVYNDTCVYCHGAPGKDPDDIGKGLNPSPPYLVDTASRWSDPELLWIVTNGIRMTGMPSFGKSHPEADLRAVVAFVRQLPKLSPDQYAALEKEQQ